MQHLVEGTEKVQISHEGILFLLRDMGIHPPRQQSWVESECTRKYYSPCFSLPKEYVQTPHSSVTNAVTHPARSFSTMTSLPSHQPPRPETPAIADWPTSRLPKPRTPTPHAHQPQVFRDGVLPLDFSAPKQPGLTFPKNFRTYHCPPDQITTTQAPAPNPLRKTSSDPVFFSDPALRKDVAESFGHAVQSKNDKQPAGGVKKTERRLPYKVNDDDLVAWNTGSDTGADDREEKVKASSDFVTNTWPPWNLRFDLEV
ncbi:hypothetical protein C7974DRAFT_137794 [Boeremia exigua]|uniref:uncharacterized protein n=1 Tax=Boeremia exigua TaxID=749465 RepID=UPI001E8CBAF8|nr:uncharacterized protein C7974DRAFT_137794 [Boeremia exigua]KAH6639739.1 hypothetical protein C7974DRAFT_137794 [Boeremia exigua]